MSCDLIIELNTISASLLPSAQDVGLVRIENTGSLASFAVMHFGVLLCLDKCPDSFPRKLEFACNHSLTQSLLGSGHAPVHSGQSACLAGLASEIRRTSSLRAADREMEELFGSVSLVRLLQTLLLAHGRSCL